MGLGTAVAAVSAGVVVGAATGTAVVAVAEHQGVVYEGATADVLDLYLPGGAGGMEWVDVVAPALVQQAETSATRRVTQSRRERAKEEFTKFVLGPVLGPAYGFFRP
jgi:F0F1-type ATP synthase membrane subunit c/vacuolar-type H+-ATPase subunit K